MAVVSFWSNGKQEVGKTVAMAAISTYLSINSNYKILLFDTAHNDMTFQECFWNQYDSGMSFKDKNKTDIASGLTGLTKAILSNKISPEIITNYTKIIFKNKLELLTDKETVQEDYNKQKLVFKEIIKMANKYYDLVLVDISGNIEDETVKTILKNSNLVVVSISQSARQINQYVELRKYNELINHEKKMIMLGRYDQKGVYSAKNIGRSIGEKEIYGIPYNTLFFESCNQGQVAEYFIKLRKIKDTDPNAPFMFSVKNISDNIVNKIKRLQTQMYG